MTKEFEKTKIDKILAENIIESAQTEWAAPIVFAPKKDRTLWFCVDYRKLNAVTGRDSYPIPRMDGSIDSEGKANSLLDARSELRLLADQNWRRWQGQNRLHIVPPINFFIRTPLGLQKAPAHFNLLWT